MALAWFRYNGPVNDSDPVVNPLNFTLSGSTPPFTPGGNTLAYIFATLQIINGVQRPTIPTSSPTGSVTVSEIHTALQTGTSSQNAYLRNMV